MPTTRREALTVAAVTVTLPMLQTALGGLLSASAAAPGRAPAQPPEKPGFFATTLKPADLKDNEFTAVDGHALQSPAPTRPSPPSPMSAPTGNVRWPKNPQAAPCTALAIQSRRHRRQSPRPHAAATFRHPHQRRRPHRNRPWHQGRQRRQKFRHHPDLIHKRLFRHHTRLPSSKKPAKIPATFEQKKRFLVLGGSISSRPHRAGYICI